MASVRVEAVDGPRGHRDFYHVKRLICKAHPASVLTLRRLEWALLDTSRHPFYQHAERQMFVAYEGRRPVGRIVALQDHMHNEYHQDRLGFFGFFECVDEQEIANQLLQCATAWLRDRDCDRMRGPVNPSMKGEFGVLVEGNEYPAFFMTPWTPMYYDRLLREAGLEVCKRFLAYLLDCLRDHEQIEANLVAYRALHDRILKRYPEFGVSKATRGNVLELIREINLIGNTVRSEGFGFVPNTEAELDYLVEQVKRILDPSIVIVTHAEERLTGYNVGVPNINWALKRAKGPWDWIRIPQLLFWMKRIPEVRTIALGVDEKLRRKGPSVLLSRWMMESYRRYPKWEFSWIAEDNQASIDAVSHAVPVKKYKVFQLYERPI